MTVNTSEPALYGIPLSLWGANVQQVKARLDYGSYVSHPHKYVYVETPKAACTKMKMLIHRLEGLPPVKPVLKGPAQSKAYMYIHARQSFHMPSLVQLPEDEARDILHGDQYYKFCFVRNPYSRLVSVWRNKVRLVEPRYESMYKRAHELYPEEFDGKFLTFPGFVQFLCDERNRDYSNPHWALQCSLLFPQAINYNFIGNVEQFDASIAEIEAATGISFNTGRDRRIMNASVPEDWRSYYTKELAEAVYALYKKDFDTFGYEIDSWKGGESLAAKSQREVFLEDEIYERNRVISMLSNALRDQG